MLETRSPHMDFSQLSTDNSVDIKSLQSNFEHSDSISAQQVTEYAQGIVQKINEGQSEEEQKIFLINLLSDSSIAEMIGHYDLDNNDKPEVEQAAAASVKAIKQRIVRELEKTLSPELYFFVIKDLGDRSKNSNGVKIVSDARDNETFFKETEITTLESYTVPLRQSLERLKSAFAALPSSDDMPYVVRPVIVNDPEKKGGPKKVSYTAEKRDIITVKDVLEGKDENFSVRDGLMAVVDCLRGAKFLSENNLTMSDISSCYAGMNLGVDRGTKKGLLFDLDGLMQTDKIATVAARANNPDGSPGFAMTPPEYHYMDRGIFPNSQSMVWEVGCVILRIAQEKIINNDVNVVGWKELETASLKMVAYDPKKRPDFDTSISVLEEIINRNIW